MRFSLIKLSRACQTLNNQCYWNSLILKLFSNKPFAQQLTDFDNKQTLKIDEATEKIINQQKKEYNTYLSNLKNEEWLYFDKSRTHISNVNDNIIVSQSIVIALLLIIICFK